MFYKQLLSFIFTCLSIIVTHAQMDSSSVEIWGVPNDYSEFSYMQYLNQKKITPCMVDLNRAGFHNAYVAGVENLRLVILRNIPVYRFNPNVKKSKIYPPGKVIDLLYFGMNDDETNFIKQGYFDFRKKDSIAINDKLTLYKQYRIVLNREKIYEKFALIESLDSVSKASKKFGNDYKAWDSYISNYPSTLLSAILKFLALHSMANAMCPLFGLYIFIYLNG